MGLQKLSGRNSATAYHHSHSLKAFMMETVQFPWTPSLISRIS